MWGRLRCGCGCRGFGGFNSSFLSLFTFLCVRVIRTLSSGYVRAPLPYRLVNAGSFDYKKKRKKKDFFNAVKANIYVSKPLIPEIIGSRSSIQRLQDK